MLSRERMIAHDFLLLFCIDLGVKYTDIQHMIHVLEMETSISYQYQSQIFENDNVCLTNSISSKTIFTLIMKPTVFLWFISANLIPRYHY